MPLSNVEIKQELQAGTLGITPFDEDMLQPARALWISNCTTTSISALLNAL